MSIKLSINQLVELINENLISNGTVITIHYLCPPSLGNWGDSEKFGYLAGDLIPLTNENIPRKYSEINKVRGTICGDWEKMVQKANDPKNTTVLVYGEIKEDDMWFFNLGKAKSDLEKRNRRGNKSLWAR